MKFLKILLSVLNKNDIIRNLDLTWLLPVLIYSDLLEIEVNDTEASASVACCITEQLVAQFCDQGSLSYTRHFQSSCDGGSRSKSQPHPCISWVVFISAVCV